MLRRNIAIIDKGIIVENTSMKALLATLNIETFVFDIENDTDNLVIEGFETRALDKFTIEVDVPKAEG